MPSRLTTELPSDMPAAIRQLKAHLREQIGDVAGALAEVEEAMRTEVGAVGKRSTPRTATGAAMRADRWRTRPSTDA